MLKVEKGGEFVGNGERYCGYLFIFFLPPLPPFFSGTWEEFDAALFV
jgi:hypothetical protein